MELHVRRCEISHRSVCTYRRRPRKLYNYIHITYIHIHMQYVYIYIYGHAYYLSPCIPRPSIYPTSVLSPILLGQPRVKPVGIDALDAETRRLLPACAFSSSFFIWEPDTQQLPSGYLTVRHAKSPCLIGKPSINGPSIPWPC